MKRFAAHFLYSGSGKFLTRQVLCLDDEGFICSIQPLVNETASTVFLNGILCSAFYLPGSKDLLTTGEAIALLNKIRDTDPLLQICDFLEFYTDMPDLKIGLKPTLWCIDPVDLKNLLFLNNSSLYSVFP